MKCSCPVDRSRPQPNNPNFVTHWFSNRNLARCYPGRNCWIPYFAFQDLKNLYLMRHCIDPIFCAVHCHPKSSIFFYKNNIGMFDELNRSRTVSWRTDGRKMEKIKFQIHIYSDQICLFSTKKFSRNENKKLRMIYKFSTSHESQVAVRLR